ncbi:MAG: hypothetical protein LAT68_16620 [Cyclobacteriaceae bacterium]|nr:hypothetical protein [Cyclobacteriaceae bacterium]MCH8517926.1 hypothetical protein [Cyclobacteriaceae bacterium]
MKKLIILLLVFISNNLFSQVDVYFTPGYMLHSNQSESSFQSSGANTGVSIIGGVPNLDLSGYLSWLFLVDYQNKHLFEIGLSNYYHYLNYTLIYETRHLTIEEGRYLGIYNWSFPIRYKYAFANIPFGRSEHYKIRTELISGLRFGILQAERPYDVNTENFNFNDEVLARMTNNIRTNRRTYQAEIGIGLTLMEHHINRFNLYLIYSYGLSSNVESEILLTSETASETIRVGTKNHFISLGINVPIRLYKSELNR